MESKHAGDPYACRAEIWPPLLPAAEIKDLLLDGPPMIYIRDPVASHFHKHLVVHKEQASSQEIGRYELLVVKRACWPLGFNS